MTLANDDDDTEREEWALVCESNCLCVWKLLGITEEAPLLQLKNKQMKKAMKKTIEILLQQWILIEFSEMAMHLASLYTENCYKKMKIS